MLSLQSYHYLHLIGLILVFIGIGGMLSSEGAKKAMMWHGIGLLISIISGFGMLAKLGIMGTMPVWAWIKIGLWLVLGFLPVLAKRRVIATPLVVLIAAITGAALAYLGYFKLRYDRHSCLSAPWLRRCSLTLSSIDLKLSAGEED